MESRKRTPNIKSSVGKDKDTETSERSKVLKELKAKSLYDTKEACDFLGISQQSLRRAIAAGKIKTVRIGKYLRIPAEEIERITMGDLMLINVEEASELLNISVTMVRSLIKAGKIQAFRLAKSGPFKIPKSEIDRIHREGIPQ